MISRKTLFFDRLATLLLSLVLMASGALGLWWWSGRSPLPDRIDASPVLDVIDQSWFPWAAVAVGLVLALLGVRWMVAHLGRSKVKYLTLGGSGPSGRFRVEGAKAADAAGDVYAETIGVRKARGSVDRDRGQLVAHISATIEPEADLRLLAERADAVSGQLAAVLGRDDLRCSVELSVATFESKLPRVR